MLGRTYESQNCSAARALEVVGERWSLLIIRDAIFRGITKFTDFQRSLGVAPNVLASRLDGFVAAGLMAPHQYGQSVQQREYRLTEKGRDLQPVIIALTAWGDRWSAPQGPPVVFEHTRCGTAVRQHTRCPACATELSPEAVRAAPGPGRHRSG